MLHVAMPSDISEVKCTELLAGLVFANRWRMDATISLRYLRVEETLQAPAGL